MNLVLPAHIQKLIDQRVNTGKYQTAEDVVAAAVEALDQQETYGEFEAGELDELLAEGERDIAQGDTVDADEVFEQLRRLSAEKRGSSR